LILWAKERLAGIEATVDPAHINDDLKEEDLFPEVDELLDPKGEPLREPGWW
jgi:hypothetical protein